MSLRVIPVITLLLLTMALVPWLTASSWAMLPPTATELIELRQKSSVKTELSPMQKPVGPAMVLKLSSPKAKSVAMKPISRGSSRLGYQTRLQNPNNPYGRTTFPVEPDEEPAVEAPPPAQTAQPPVIDEPEPIQAPQATQSIQPKAQRPQPAPPVWPAQADAAKTPQAKSPVIDPWRQAQAVPEGATPELTPPAQGNEPAGQSFNLQTQKGALARTYMFRQLTPRPYKSYMVSVKALMASLHDTFVYLRGLNGELPDLQRLSAFQARVRVEWLAFQKKLPPDSEKFSSYKSIAVSVAELDAMSAYWINRNRVKRVYQGTLDQEYTDEALFQTRIANLKNSLANLEALAQTEREVVREIPYAY